MRPLSSVWGKSRVRFGELDWLPLEQHALDAARVAGMLWDEWLTPNVRGTIGHGHTLDARGLAVFLTAVHDVGKITPAFAAKCPVLADDMRVAGLPLPQGGVDSQESRRLPHGLAGQVILERWLATRGWRREPARALGAVVGGHHGVPPDVIHLRDAAVRHRLLGDEAWSKAQDQLLNEMAEFTGFDVGSWSTHRLSQPAAMLLTGLVIMADWIASNPELFPLVPVGTSPGDDESRWAYALERLDLPGPWQPVTTQDEPADLLRSRFDLPGPSPIRPVQEHAVRLARTLDLPGIMVIEAPMGEGKTEAALLAAEILAARGGLGGICIALPTQATSDAMFDRVLAWLRRLPDAELELGPSTTDRVRRSVSLTHGRAALNDAFRSLRFPGRPEGVGIDEQVPPRQYIDGTAASWTTGRKRRNLSDFTIGTIDQVLFTSLRARHLALRHLGIARQVVVIDEVHAVDTWMSTYLHRALEWLAAYRVPVVLLSATLPSQVRQDLVKAYQRGLDTGPTEARAFLDTPTWAAPDGVS